MAQKNSAQTGIAMNKTYSSLGLGNGRGVFWVPGLSELRHELSNPCNQSETRLPSITLRNSNPSKHNGTERGPTITRISWQVALLGGRLVLQRRPRVEQLQQVRCEPRQVVLSDLQQRHRQRKNLRADRIKRRTRKQVELGLMGKGGRGGSGLRA